MNLSEWVRLQANSLSLFSLSWDNMSLFYGEDKFPFELSKEEWDIQFKEFIENYEATKDKLGYTEKVSQA